MTKREEYHIKFYKQKDKDNDIIYIFDVNDCDNQHKGLYFIGSLHPVEMQSLMNTITAIQNSQPYDPDFLKESEVYTVFSVQFINPNFWVGGIQTIHMNDLKTLLQEWLAYINA